MDKYIDEVAPVKGIVVGVFDSKESQLYKDFLQLAYNNSGRYNFGYAINDDGSWYVKFDID